jgi:branched-chain amino acid transport system permease protein
MNRKWLWVLIALVVLLLAAAPAGLEPYPYFMHIAIVALFYAILASSWSLLAGYAGQFSFAHMAFMAIGAYTAALFGRYVRLTTAPSGTCPEIPLGNTWLVLINPYGQDCLELARASMPVGTQIYRLPVTPGIVLGVIVGGIFGFLIGFLVLRLRRTYLALFTIGFSEIVRITLNAEIELTGGPNGLELAPLFPDGIYLFGFYFSPTNKIPPYYAMLALFLGAMAFMYWLAGSRFGLFIRAIREDEEAAAALGVHTVRYKVLVFAITAMIAAMAGAVFAHYIGVITPNILLILTLIGAAIGAILIEFALEFLRTSFNIGPIEVDMSTWRLVFFGLLLMLTLRFWNNGLISPIIQRLTRSGVAQETVAKRAAPAEGAPDGVAEGQG